MPAPLARKDATTGFIGGGVARISVPTTVEMFDFDKPGAGLNSGTIAYIEGTALAPDHQLWILNRDAPQIENPVAINAQNGGQWLRICFECVI